MPIGIQGFQKGNKLGLGNKYNLGRHWNLSDEVKRKIGNANKISLKKKWQDPEYRKHMVEVHKGQTAWNKGKKTGIVPKSVFKKGCQSLMKGKKHSEETRNKISLSRRGKGGKKGELAWNWKGGTSRTINKIIRQSTEYKLWREAVFKRDNYQCIWGGKEHGSKLHADHIKPFALYPELRFAIDNGRTLCIECHYKTDTYGGKTR